MGTEPENGLTIEELARETGLSVRNIRSHRTAGLLPAPEVRDGLGWYGPEHLDRLRLVRELQAEGFNLRGIQRLLDEGTGTAGSLLVLRRALSEPFTTAPATVVSLAELTERLGTEAGPDVLAKAIELEAVIPLGDDRFELPNPAVLDMAERVAAGGVPLAVALELLELVLTDLRHIAGAFVDAFVDHVWSPSRSTDGSTDWRSVSAALEALRPIASEGVLTSFQQVMAEEVERRSREEMHRMADEPG